MNFQSIKRTLFERFVLPHISYYDGQMYRFLSEGNTITLSLANENFSPIVTIFSRNQYSEDLKSVPIEDKKQALQFLKLEQHSDINSASRITITEDGNTYYNTWKFEGVSFNANFYIPETIILAGRKDENAVITTVNSEPKLYTSSSRFGINSSYETVFIKNEAHFRTATGLGNADSMTLAKEDVYNYLVKGALKLPLSGWKVFFQKKSIGSFKETILSLLKPISYLIAGYLLITSIYLTVHNAYLEYQFETLQKSVSNALALQTLVDKKLNVYIDFKEVEKRLYTHTGFWVIMADVFETAEISNLRFQNERYILRGQVNKATVILQQLLKLEGVEDARFDFPTRRSRNKEVFVISFKMKKVY